MASEWDQFKEYTGNKTQQQSIDPRAQDTMRAGKATIDAFNKSKPVAKDVAWQGLTGLAEGALKTPGYLAGDLPTLAVETLARLPYNVQKYAPSIARDVLGVDDTKIQNALKMPRADYSANPLGSQNIRKLEHDYLGFNYPQEPQTTLGKYTRAATEQVAPALVMGGQNLLGNVGRAMAGGVGGQAGADLYPKSEAAPFVGSLLGGFSPEIYSATRDAFTPNMTLQAAQNAQTLMDRGVPVYPGAAASNKMVNNVYSQMKNMSWFPSNAAADQTDAVNRVMSRTIGEDTPNMTQAMQDAHARHGATYDELRGRTVAQFDTAASRGLTRILNRARRDITDPNELALVERKIQEVRDTAARGRGAIRGASYKNLIGEKGSITKALTNNTKSNALPGVGQDIEDVINGMFDRSMSTEDQATMRQTNREYRNSKTLQPVMASAVNGQISPQRIPHAIANATGGQTAWGDAGLPELSDIARGAPLMKAPPDSGTTSRMVAAQLGSPLALGAAGTLLAGSPGGLLAGAASVAAPPAIERMLESQRLMRAMIDKANRRAGAIPAGLTPATAAVPALTSLTGGLLGRQNLTPQWTTGGLLVGP